MTRRASQPDDAVVAALARVDLFSDLTTADLQQIAAMCRPERFESGSEIVAQGDTSGRFYLVLEGTADIIVNGAKVGEVGPGGSFGEIAVIDRGPRSASVQATSALQACSVASITLRPLLKEHPEMSYRLLVGVCHLLRRAQGTLVT
jgi:CRP-like cAMP-binding protein